MVSIGKMFNISVESDEIESQSDNGSNEYFAENKLEYSSLVKIIKFRKTNSKQCRVVKVCEVIGASIGFSYES